MKFTKYLVLIIVIILASSITLKCQLFDLINDDTTINTNTNNTNNTNTIKSKQNKSLFDKINDSSNKNNTIMNVLNFNEVSTRKKIQNNHNNIY